MRWTAARARVERLLSPAVQSRVGLHVARYERDCIPDGRGWITWDGRELSNFHTAQFNNSVFGPPYERGAEAYERRVGEAQDAGLFAHYHFTRAIESYPELAIDAALGSEDPIVRGLAMLDRRLGKRRLVGLQLGTDEQPFVRELLELRCAAEGLRRA